MAEATAVEVITLVGGPGDGRTVHRVQPRMRYDVEGPFRVTATYTPERYWLQADLPGAEHWRELPACTVHPAPLAPVGGVPGAMLCVRVWATADRHAAIRARMDDQDRQQKLRRAYAVQQYPTGDATYDLAVFEAAATEVGELARMLRPGWDG